ncbi:hypothetical protein K9L67_01530 [Candidatus Woesearchaeota archaeon]|nr:hypothetical protein [Candidatus Woesearchaeota archaeon]MCF7900884.1 hypothetical protein [Candidatus Woesearchaeota archaeon]MCF8013067.1 hypothetical protein [Candidatus Woesearchaeota archaeon]
MIKNYMPKKISHYLFYTYTIISLGTGIYESIRINLPGEPIKNPYIQKLFFKEQKDTTNAFKDHIRLQEIKDTLNINQNKHKIYK